MKTIEAQFYWGKVITVIPTDFCGSVHVQLLDECYDGFITNLCVHPDDRNKGYGTKLMAEAERIIIEYGRTESSLYVEKDKWLVDWYKRLGYEIVENCSGDDHYYTMGKKLK